MPLCTIQNRLPSNLAIPPPVGLILGPNAAVTVALTLFSLESSPDLKDLLNLGLITLIVAEDPSTPDALEGGVLSIVSGSTAAATAAAAAALASQGAAAASAAAALVSEGNAAATLAGAMTKAAIRDISFSVAAEAADARVVSCLVKDGDGTTVAAATEVYVEVIAPTAGKGFIAVTTGTSVVLLNDVAGQVHRAWITTTAAGAFAFSVTDNLAETVLVRAAGDNGALSHVSVAFA